MKKLILLFLLPFILSSCSVFTPLQRSKLISVFHLIETSNYEEAKNVVEEMILDEEFSQWSRTWYARGLLAHTAYQEGRRRNNRQMFELYPDQIFVAYSSFERARRLDGRGRYDRQLAPRYVFLANEFKQLGQNEFNRGKHKEALRAFQKALQITENPILSVNTDTDLIFNTAIAAYESSNKPLAIELLNRLNSYEYSPNASHLLFTIHLEKQDTIAAENALREGISIYEANQDLILILVDLLYAKGQHEQALEMLAEATQADQQNFIFPYTRGLIFQKEGKFEESITYYKKAIELAPDELFIYTNIATSFFNIGVEIDERSRTVSSNTIVQAMREESSEAFDSAIHWLNKAYDRNPEDQQVISRMFELYRLLSVNDKARSLELRMK